MGAKTAIQWCDGTVNPVAGCDGCELFETREQVVARIAGSLTGDLVENRKKLSGIAERFADETPLKASCLLIEAMVSEGLIDGAQAEGLKNDTAGNFKCYAARLSETYHHRAGWPDVFDTPKQFAGRMAKAAKLKDLTGTARIGKEWLDGQPRSMFVSDMGDALSAWIGFEYLRDEIITAVTSAKGSQHVWQWVTKRPKQMAKFATWLTEQGIAWPDNLMALTTVTSNTTAYRVNDLRKVPSKMRGLSIEPLWEEVKLDLTGIDWVIVGGESGKSAAPFHIEWALSLREQCRDAGVAFFLKQVGARPFFGGVPVQVADPHGGEWHEWPNADWRVREVPDFRQLTGAGLPIAA